MYSYELMSDLNDTDKIRHAFGKRGFQNVASIAKANRSLTFMGTGTARVATKRVISILHQRVIIERTLVPNNSRVWQLRLAG